MTAYRAPALFVSHGGGPKPLLNVPDHAELARYMSQEAPKILQLNSNDEHRPKALIVVTAHWETDVPHVSTREKSELYFDYYNFPAETYKYTYKAQGSAELGQRVADAINKGGFAKVKTDSKRGWDHGVFVPLKLIAPEGLDIPLIMVSVLASQNAEQLIKLGRALEPLRDEGFAILGSGTTFHNFGGFRAPAQVKQQYAKAADVFEQAMYEQLDNKGQKTAEDTLAAFAQWEKLPNANVVQPAGATDHFSPLVVLAGTMKSRAKRAKYLQVSELPASCWQFD